MQQPFYPCSVIIGTFNINISRMNKYFALTFYCFLLFSSCGFQEQEKKIKEREMELNQREQALNIKEHALLLLEEQLNEREQKLDSNLFVPDTLLGTYPNLPGSWNVKMVCSETTCPGSAVGDSKTETWEISIQNNSVIVGALSNGTLSRIYSGNFQEDRLVVSSENTDTQTNQKVKILIRLKQTKDGNMIGTREIIRAEDCHIVYDLDVKK